MHTFLDNLLPHDLRFFVLGSSGRQYISMNWGSNKKYDYDWVIADQGDKKDFYYPRTWTSRYSLHVNMPSGNT